MFANLTVLGMQFKVVSWALGYIYLAKGDGQLFMIIEIVAGVLILLMNLLFYNLYGLNGLGISFIVTYFLSMGFSYLVLRSKYGFGLPKRFYGMLLLTYGFVVGSFLTVFIQSTLFRYLSGMAVIMLAAGFSLIKLNELMDLRSYISNRLKS